MNQVDNQKHIIVIKTNTKNGKPFALIDQEAWQRAMLLRPSTFKIWFYIASNTNKYTFNLSSKDVCSVCSLSRSTYNRAITQLIEQGFLVSAQQPNTYIFYDGGLNQESNITIQVPQEKIHQIQTFNFI